MMCIILNLQISLLDTAVNHLKANLNSAADIISLRTTVEDLEKVKANQNRIKGEFVSYFMLIGTDSSFPECCYDWQHTNKRAA